MISWNERNDCMITPCRKTLPRGLWGLFFYNDKNCIRLHAWMLVTNRANSFIKFQINRELFSRFVCWCQRVLNPGAYEKTRFTEQSFANPCFQTKLLQLHRIRSRTSCSPAWRSWRRADVRLTLVVARMTNFGGLVLGCIEAKFCK